MTVDPTFAEDIEHAASGEDIECVVISQDLAGDWGAAGSERHAAATARAGEVLSWDVARPLLDYRYDRGYGSADCHYVTAWTPSRVLFVLEYDGSTSMQSVPRHPPVEGLAHTAHASSPPAEWLTG